MKKLLSFLFTLTLAFVLVSCSNEHTHTFSDEWASDADSHWHAATCEHASEVNEKADHTWDKGTVTLEPTEQVEGKKTFTCLVCQYKKEEKIDKLTHEHTWVEADCDTPKTCSKCNATEGEALGHKAAEAVKENEVASTCKVAGSYEAVVKCSVCSEELSRKTVELELAAHTWVDADCDTPKTCSVCGVTEGEALGHSYGEWNVKTPASKENDEVQHHICENCGDEETKIIEGTKLVFFEVKFVDEDGTELEVLSIEKGELPTYTKETPTKAADEDNIYLFDGWDSELVAATENKTYTAVYNEIAKTDNGQLVWDEDNINYSIIASDFYAGLHPADLSVVQIDGKNALQVKYEEGFFDLSGTVKTTPGIQFANGNKFKLTQDSVVTFSVRVSDEWSLSNDRAGIYLFYDGEALGTINASGSLWSGATSPKVKDNVFIRKSEISVMQIFANATIGDKNWVNVAITFNGIENPDLSKLSIAYGVAQGTDYNGLLNTVDGHKNSWIYISDLTVLGPNEITWNDATMNYYLTSNDLYAGLYPADLSVVEIDGRNALKVKYQEGFFDLPETNKTTPGITFTNTDNLQLTQSSVVTFSVRVSDEWNYSNNGGGIYIFYNGEVCGTISTSGTLWSGATATGERDRYINKSLVSTMNIFANGTIGDKQWVDVTITFEGIENPDLGNLTIAYGGMHGSNFSGLLSTESQENSWIYISDITIN